MICTLLTLLVIGVAVYAVLDRDRQGPARPRVRSRPSAQVVPHRPARPPARPRKKSKPVRPKPVRNHAAGLTEAQARAIIEKALGAVWEADQERLRAQVRAQERKVAARLAKSQQALDYAELRALHQKSRQTADLAYESLGSARAMERDIGGSIRDAQRAVDAARARNGRDSAALGQALESLLVNRDVIRMYRERYEQDVQQLNQETARLRDAIGANCGAEGRRWCQGVKERAQARREGRL
jgi:hypothetical protein